MSYKRIAGGEKNLKTGQKWTEEEIIQVYHLYKKLNGVGLHEHNPEIQNLAFNLDRTVRSTEAQTLMFRNLERFGQYSHGNMNKLSAQVWNEFELRRNFQMSIPFEDIQITDQSQTYSIQEKEEIKDNLLTNSSDYILIEDENNDTERHIFNYKKWNKLLIDYYFNSKNKGKKIQCFFVSVELFDQISDSQFNYLDFELSIERSLRSKTFKQKFNEFYISSVPRQMDGRNLRKPFPEYFGLLIYLILSLSESKSDNLSITNVYDRINNFGKKRFINKWGEINTSFARDVLEPSWIDLEDWSKNYKAKSLGYFEMKDPKRSQRKFVSRIERHGLFNSRHFEQLFDVLVEIGIVPKEEITSEKWLEIFIEHENKISNSKKVIEYLKEESELKENIIKFINDYYQVNFVDSLISSHSGTIRKLSIPLLFCLKELPQWDNNVSAEKIHFRAFSTDLEEDNIEYQDALIKIEHEYREYSKKIVFNWNPSQDSTILIKGETQRYSINHKFKWLVLNRDLEEWIEVLVPTNAQNILLLVKTEVLNSIRNVIDSEVGIYETPWLGYNFIEFDNLKELQFKKLTNILGYSQVIEGKIELIGNFLVDRRRVILKEFDSQFKYSGPVANPILIAKCQISGQEWELIKEPNQSEALFLLGNRIQEKTEFFVYEKTSDIKSHFSFSIDSIKSRNLNNISRPYSKDEDGLNMIDREIQTTDIFDIPNNLNKIDFNNTHFNTYQNKLWKIFRPGKTDYLTKAVQHFSYEQEHKAEKLLNYLSIVNNIDTYKLPLLIRELNPKINAQFSKRIMQYWKDLGYINFETYGSKVKVSPPNLFFIETEKGLKAFLTGFRNQLFINKLAEACSELNLILKLTDHSDKHKNILPFKIEIYDKLGDLDKFKSLATRIGIKFINNIENPYNTSYAVYQLACFYTQRSVDEFEEYLKMKLDYKTDHHRKLVFEPKSYSWKETNRNVSDMEPPVLVRYDGFKDRQIIHIYKDELANKVLDNYALATFKLMKKNIFLLERHKINPVSDFYVPLNVSLPFWIERGLILINAKIPVIEWVDKKAYRKYQNIHDDIIKIIENKLNQKTTIIN
jgi:hypothetical protein